ncbi:MAG TPA: Pr6Pr family membrane protein [Naasia sp.]
MGWRTARGLWRLALAVTGLGALVARFLYGLGFRSFASVDYFGYLTVQSNAAAVAVFAWSGVTLLRGRPETPAISTARACVTCYLLVAGIVFALLASVAPAQGYRLEVPPSDQVLHFFVPTFALLDWLVSPGRHPVRTRVIGLMLLYPVVWGLLTIVRGRIVGWYPYFFLDPAQAGYPVSFLLYSAGALALFALVAAGLVAASRTPPVAERDPLLPRRSPVDHGPGLVHLLALLLLSRRPRRTRRDS